MEAFYCAQTMPDFGVEFNSPSGIDIVTFDGWALRLGNEDGNPSDWQYRIDEEYWQVDKAHQNGYRSTRDANGFRQSCSAFRIADIDGANLNFKQSTPYNFRTGFKIYDD